MATELKYKYTLVLIGRTEAMVQMKNSLRQFEKGTMIFRLSMPGYLQQKQILFQVNVVPGRSGASGWIIQVFRAEGVRILGISSVYMTLQKILNGFSVVEMKVVNEA